MSTANKIKLDQYLKLVGMAQTGGHAKLMIQGGGVRVNGAVEIQRGRKLVSGDHIRVQNKTFIVELDQLNHT